MRSKTTKNSKKNLNRFSLHRKSSSSYFCFWIFSFLLVTGCGFMCCCKQNPRDWWIWDIFSSPLLHRWWQPSLPAKATKLQQVVCFRFFFFLFSSSVLILLQMAGEDPRTGDNLLEERGVTRMVWDSLDRVDRWPFFLLWLAVRHTEERLVRATVEMEKLGKMEEEWGEERKCNGQGYSSGWVSKWGRGWGGCR
jgi:hypothetical protein